MDDRRIINRKNVTMSFEKKLISTISTLYALGVLMLSVLFLALTVTSCCDDGKSTTESIPDENLRILRINNQEEIRLREVTIDGNTYYACRTAQGFYTLCPKLPVKAEKP